MGDVEDRQRLEDISRLKQIIRRKQELSTQQPEPKRRGFFDNLGPIGHEIGSAVRKTVDQLTDEEKIQRIQSPGGQVASGTLLGFIQGSTGGIPREILQEGAGVEIPRGNIVGEMAGAVGTGIGLDKALKRKTLEAIPKGNLADPRKIPKGVTLARNALSGLAGSQLIRPSESSGFFNPQERGLNAALGLLFGPSVAAVARTGSAIGGAVKNILKPVAKSKQFPARFERTVQGLMDKATAVKQKTTKFIKQVNDDLVEKNRIADDLVQTRATASARQAQIDLDNNFRAGKKQYSDSIDSVVKKIDAEKPFTEQDLINAITETLEEADEKLLPTGGRQRFLLEQMLKDLKPSAAGRTISGKTVDIGRLSPEVSSQINKALGVDPTKMLPVDKMLQAKRAVDSTISASGKAGRFESTDIVSAIFNKNIGKRIAERSKDYIPVQNSYTQLVERMKIKHRLFGQGTGASGTRGAATGTRRIQSVVRKEAIGPEVEELRRLEAGGKLGGKIKSTTEPARKIQAEKLRFAAEAKKKISQAKLLEQDILKKLEKRKLTLAKRKEIFEDLKQQQRAIQDLRRSLERGAIDVGRVALIIAVLKDIKRRVEGD